MPKPLTVWITTNCGKFFKRWEYQTTWPASWEICMQVKKQQLELKHGKTDWFQIGKRVRQGCVLSPWLFNLYAEYIMRNAGLEEAQIGTQIHVEGVICLQTVMLEKTLESPLGSKEIKSINPKGNQAWIFIGRTDAEVKAPILCLPDVKSHLIGKTLMLGRIKSRRRSG